MELVPEDGEQGRELYIRGHLSEARKDRVRDSYIDLCRRNLLALFSESCFQTSDDP